MSWPSLRRLHALDLAWDRVVAPASLNADGEAPDPLTLAVVRRVHADLAPPSPDPTFLDELLEDLMGSLPAGSRVRSASLPIPAGDTARRAVNTAPARSMPAPERRPVRRWWPQSLDAAVAGLVVLLLVAMAAGNDRISGLFVARDDAPTGATAMLLGNAARTGEMPGPFPAGNPGLLWRADIGGGGGSPGSSPVVANGLVYVVGNETVAGQIGRVAVLLAIDLDTGEVRWRNPIEGLGDFGSPAVADGLVFIGTSGAESAATPEAGTIPTMAEASDGYLVAVDAETGVERWRYRTGRSGYLSPAVVDGTIYIGSVDGTLHAVDAKTGQGRWTYGVESDGEVLSASSPTVADGLVFIGSNLGVVHALDAETGALRWQTSVGWASTTTAAVAGDTLYVVAPGGKESVAPNPRFENGISPTHADWRLVALDIGTGEQRWSVDISPAPIGVPPVVSGQLVLVGGAGPRGEEIMALDATDGTERWRAAANDAAGNPPVDAGDVIVYGSFDSSVYARDLATGHLLWQVETGGAITTTAYIADGVIVVGSADGNLYAIGGTGSAPGTPVATPAPDGDISGLTACDIDPLPVLTPVPIAEGERTAPAADGDETPSASLVPVSDAQRRGSTPGLAWEDVPTGPPADAATLAAIEETIAGMEACARPGREEQLAAYYSDGFYLRPWVRWQLRYNGYPRWTPGSGGISDMGIDQTVVLPDGRVAAIFRYEAGAVSDSGVETIEVGWLAVFVKEDGRWLVDELLEVTPYGGEGRG
jgi:outer membrane protein assembly factor BamB